MTLAPTKSLTNVPLSSNITAQPKIVAAPFQNRFHIEPTLARAIVSLQVGESPTSAVIFSTKSALMYKVIAPGHTDQRGELLNRGAGTGADS